MIAVLLPAVPAAAIIYKNFFFFRRGWDTPEIQYQVVFWLLRMSLAPLLVYFIIKFRERLTNAWLLLQLQINGLIAYTIFHWSLSFILCRSLNSFDGRNRNLFNTIRTESFLLNLIVFCITFYVTCIWVYLEYKKGTTERILQLEKLLTLANQKVLNAVNQKTIALPAEPLDNLTVKNGDRTIIIPLFEIVCLLANGPYIKVITEKSTYLLHRRLYDVQAKLPGIFQRIHRSHIVNTSFVRGARSLINGDYIILLSTGAEIRASRTYRDKLKPFLSTI